jgi:cell division GTPase FtsZ
MKNHFGKEVEQVIVCVGAGGGTGGGAIFGAIETAKEFLKTHGKSGAKVGVVVSQPANSEGSAVVNNALEQIKHLVSMSEAKEITPLVIAENAKILRIYPKTKLGARWDVINRSVCGIFDAFNVLACQSSQYATFDHQDYRKIMDSGLVIYGRSVLAAPKSKTDLSDAIRKNLTNGFLSDGVDMSKATVAGCVLVANKEVLDDLDQEAYDMAFETLQRVIGSPNVVMYQGIISNPDVDGVHLFTIVGGIQKVAQPSVDLG